MRLSLMLYKVIYTNATFLNVLQRIYTNAAFLNVIQFIYSNWTVLNVLQVIYSNATFLLVSPYSFVIIIFSPYFLLVLKLCKRCCGLGIRVILNGTRSETSRRAHISVEGNRRFLIVQFSFKSSCAQRDIQVRRNRLVDKDDKGTNLELANMIGELS